MKIKTHELIGETLEWAVIVARYPHTTVDHFLDMRKRQLLHREFYCSTSWAFAGPIIEQEQITITPYTHDDPPKGVPFESVPVDGYVGWLAVLTNPEALIHMDVYDTAFEIHGYHASRDPSPLVAAMRCYVSSRLGDEVDVPEELT